MARCKVMNKYKLLSSVSVIMLCIGVAGAAHAQIKLVEKEAPSVEINFDVLESLRFTEKFVFEDVSDKSPVELTKEPENKTDANEEVAAPSYPKIIEKDEKQIVDEYIDKPIEKEESNVVVENPTEEPQPAENESLLSSLKRRIPFLKNSGDKEVASASNKPENIEGLELPSISSRQNDRIESIKETIDNLPPEELPEPESSESSASNIRVVLPNEINLTDDSSDKIAPTPQLKPGITDKQAAHEQETFLSEINAENPVPVFRPGSPVVTTEKFLEDEVKEPLIPEVANVTPKETKVPTPPPAQAFEDEKIDSSKWNKILDEARKKAIIPESKKEEDKKEALTVTPEAKSFAPKVAEKPIEKEQTKEQPKTSSVSKTEEIVKKFVHRKKVEEKSDIADIPPPAITPGLDEDDVAVQDNKKVVSIDAELKKALEEAKKKAESSNVTQKKDESVVSSIKGLFSSDKDNSVKNVPQKPKVNPDEGKVSLSQLINKEDTIKQNKLKKSQNQLSLQTLSADSSDISYLKNSASKGGDKVLSPINSVIEKKEEKPQEIKSEPIKEVINPEPAKQELKDISVGEPVKSEPLKDLPNDQKSEKKLELAALPSENIKPAVPETQALTNVIKPTPVSNEKEVNVNFSGEDIQLTEADKNNIRALVNGIKADNTVRLKVISRAKGVEGKANSSRRISLQRAIAIRNFLVEEGLDSVRINVQAVGDSVENKSLVDTSSVMLLKSE